MYGKDLIESGEALSYPTFNLPTNLVRPSREGQGWSDHGYPIPNEEGFGEAIYISVTRAWYSGKRDDYIPDFGGTYPIRCEAYRFYQSVVAYYDSPNPVISPSRLFSLIKMEYKAIKWLKAVRSYCMMESLGLYPQETSEEDEFYMREARTFKKLIDLGDFFNVRYWLFFDQPDEHFEQFLFKPLVYEKSAIEHFERVAREIIPEVILDVIAEEEILLDITSSNALWKGKTVPVWYAKQTENYFSSKPLVGRGSFIQKCPGDTRFPITLSVPHSNSVKLIEKQMALLAAEMPWSAYVKDPDTFGKRYRKFRRGSKFFYCRDIEKDGLTKNRKLIQIICKVVAEKYPHLPCVAYFGIFDNFYVEIDGKLENPPRGVGLGMTSALTTILQSIVFRMNLDKLTQEYTVGTADAIFYHDDAAFGSDNEDTLEDLKDIDFLTCKSLGLPVKKRKCFSGPEFVLCENYSDSIFDTKESYQRTSLQLIHCATNVTHAKQMWLSNYRYVDPWLWKDYIRSLTNHFGWEFYPEEVNAPALLGGWIPATYQRVDISLDTIGRLPYKTEQAASMVGLQPVGSFPGRRRFKGDYEHPVKKLFPFAKNFGKRSVFLEGMTAQQVSGAMTRLNKVGLVPYYWEKQYSLRQAKYQSYYKGPWMTLREWYDGLREVHPTLDIFPPRQLVSTISVEGFPEMEKVYKPPNPRISYLKALNPGALSDKIIPFPVPPDVVLSSSLQLTAFERTKVRLESHFFERWTQDLLEMQIVIPTHRAIYSREWFNPMSMVSYWAATRHEERLPVYKDRQGSLELMPKELFYKLNNPEHLDLFPYLVGRLGFTRVYNLDLTYFEEGISTLLQKRRIEKLKEVYNSVLRLAQIGEEDSQASEEANMEVDSGFSWDNASLHDSDFFVWQTSRKNYLNWRNHYFLSLDSKLVNIQLLQTSYMNNATVDEIPEIYRLDPVEEHLYRSSGGVLNADGFPELNRHIFMSASHEAERDVFDEGSSDDSGGLMAGW
jgi:hypothetical protein